MVFTLAALGEHPSSPVSAKSKDCIAKLREIAPDYGVSADELASKPLHQVADALLNIRYSIPDKSSELSRIDVVLVPILELERCLPVLGSTMEAMHHVDPAKQDMLLTDVTHDDLTGHVAENLQVAYLEHTDPKLVKSPVQGMLYGENFRVMVNLVVSKRHRHVNVIFLVDTGSPYTYVAAPVLEALGFTEHIPSSTQVLIHGLPAQVYRSTHGSHFEDINVLGSVFMANNQFHLDVDYSSWNVTLSSLKQSMLV